jgi:uncharacterized protein (TIGR02284 family)
MTKEMSMKYVMLAFMLLVSVSAYTARTTSQEPTQLDDLIRGEMAAMEAYDVALKDVKDKNQKSKLQKIRNEHEKNISILSKFVASKTELLEDTSDSGPWGEFAKAWTKTRSFVDNEGALKALRQGEEHGVKEYKEALEDKSINAQLKDTIRKQMLPNQEKHIETLKTLI